MSELKDPLRVKTLHSVRSHQTNELKLEQVHFEFGARVRKTLVHYYNMTQIQPDQYKHVMRASTDS